MPPLFNIHHVKEWLQQDAIILTPNLRLARKIREAWAQHCIQLNKSVWQDPNVFSFDAWIQVCWSNLQDRAHPDALSGLPVTPVQERVIWEQLIEEDTTLPGNTNPKSFSDMAMKGWQLVGQWQIDFNKLKNDPHPGLHHLLRWGNTFEQTLTSRHLLSKSRQLEIIKKAFSDQDLAPVDTLVLVGFQTTAPQVEAVLSRAGKNIVRLQGGMFDSPTRQAEQFVADSLDSEIAQAARWVHNIHQREPNARIALVAPQLAANRERIERIFRNQFEPQWNHPSSSYREPPFNISAGTPLSTAPVISAALQLLQLLKSQLEVTSLCSLLRNPFWSHFAQEGYLRCQIQRNLLELGVFSISGAGFRQLCHRLEANEQGTVDSKALSQLLVDLAGKIRSVDHRLSHQRWQSIFSESLTHLGWPGTRTPDSLEYQQLEHWQTLLKDFAALDHVAQPVTLIEAIKQLRHLASETVFHPQTSDSNIQILGLLEAAGLEFDYLWLMDMDTRHWPQVTTPHPLIPARLQRQLSMPRSCPERELALSTELFTLFSNSARQIIFSYSQWDGDLQLQPSHMLAELPCAKFPHASERHPWLMDIFNCRDIECVEDNLGPDFTRGENTRGGAALIADQAQCPFNAFARWRLGAESLPEPASGLGPLIRGNLVHGTLELLWQRLQNRDALVLLDSAQRQALLSELTDISIRQYINSVQGILTRQDIGERLLDLEKQRQLRLLELWLDTEISRPSFNVVNAEKLIKLDLKGLTLRIRIDRIDELDTGQLAVIDYKTGIPTLAGLTTLRLTEPQLALYALAIQQKMDKPVTALAYGVINQKQLGFSGLSSESGLMPGTKTLSELKLDTTWQETLANWRVSLDSLASEFLCGHADVIFFSRQAMDYNTDLLPLNRWPSYFAVNEALVNASQEGDRS